MRIVALILGGMAPLTLLISAGKIVPLRVSFFYYLVPAFILLIVLAVIWSREADDFVGKQVGVSFMAGIALTLVLDALRWGAVANKFMPMDIQQDLE